jgi:1,4-dihydroxy-2-naphthoate octaprenyltransferase
MTLAVRFGDRFARNQYVFCMLAAAMVPVVLLGATGTHEWSLLAGASLLLGVPVARRVLAGLGGVELNPLLGFTGRLSIIYSLVFSLTWLL